MRNRALSSVGVLGVVGLCAFLLGGTVQAKEKLGKVFIKAGSSQGDGQFVDPGLEETVKDMKKRPGDFVVVNNESDAEFLLVVLTREDTALAGHSSDKRITATLSTKDGSAWKPAIKLNKSSHFWTTTADHVIDEAEKWVKSSMKK